MTEFKNLYALLNVPFNATTADIKKAIKHCAETQSVELADLQLCVKTLLNEEARKEYDIDYFKEYPKSLDEFLDSEKPPEKSTALKKNPNINRSVKKSSGSGLGVIIVVIGLLIFFFLYSSCSNRHKQKIIEVDSFDSPPISTEIKNEADRIRRGNESIVFQTGELNTRYRIVWHKKKPNGLFEAITERIGSSGTSYSKREIDCNSHSIRYLGEGDTLEESLIYRPDPKLTSTVEGSSADKTVNAVCMLGF